VSPGFVIFFVLYITVIVFALIRAPFPHRKLLFVYPKVPGFVMFANHQAQQLLVFVRGCNDFWINHCQLFRLFVSFNQYPFRSLRHSAGHGACSWGAWGMKKQLLYFV
jgi:hypothetical protein